MHLTCMRPNVLLQVRELREFPLTNLATIRFDAQVDAGVLRQVARVGERFRTLRAFVWFGFTHVDLGMQL